MSVFLTVGITLFQQGTRAQNQDACRDVLQDGIRDQFSLNTQTNLKTSFKTGFCNSYRGASSGSSGGGLGVSIPLADAILGVKGNFSQSQQQDMASKYCASGSSDLSNDDYTAMMKRVASTQVVEAWSMCMHDRAPVAPGVGLTSEIDTAGGDDFVFKFRWVAGLNQNSARVQDFFVSNAICRGTSVQPNATIGTGWSVAQCTRKDAGPVMVTVSAADQLGATTQKLPGRSTTPSPQPTDSKTQCMNGSATACSSLWQQTKASCGYDAACIARSQCWMDKSRAITLIKISCQPDQNGQVNQQSCQFQTQNAKSVAERDCDTF